MKNLNKILLSGLSLFLATPVFATGDVSACLGDDCPKQLTELGAILDKVMNLLFPFAGIVCVIFIIIGGYMWLTSAGDPAKIQQAQGTLTWAIIGLVFVLIAVAIIKVITTFVVT